MSQMLNIFSWALINPLWLATQTSGGTCSSSCSHPAQISQISIFFQLPLHTLPSRCHVTAWFWTVPSAEKLCKLSIFSLFPFTHTQVPYSPPPPSRSFFHHGLGAGSSAEIHQKSSQSTSEVSFSSRKGNENHWQATQLLFLWGCAWLTTAPIYLWRWYGVTANAPLPLPLRFSFAEAVNSWSTTTNTRPSGLSYNLILLLAVLPSVSYVINLHLQTPALKVYKHHLAQRIHTHRQVQAICQAPLQPLWNRAISEHQLPSGTQQAW